jgi:hypothetical protein
MLPFHLQACFLPESLGMGYNSRSLVAKVLTSLLENRSSTLAAQHAATQLLLRLKYLILDDTDAVTTGTGLRRSLVPDYGFDRSTTFIAKQMSVANKVRSGAKPRVDVFTRRIVRCDVLRNGQELVFPSAVDAMQEVSFGSVYAKHAGPMDDIWTANNIADCADGKRPACYGFSWSWADPQATHHRGGRKKNSLLAFALGMHTMCGCDTTASA